MISDILLIYELYLSLRDTVLEEFMEVSDMVIDGQANFRRQYGRCFSGLCIIYSPALINSIKQTIPLLISKVFCSPRQRNVHPYERSKCLTHLRAGSTQGWEEWITSFTRLLRCAKAVRTKYALHNGLVP